MLNPVRRGLTLVELMIGLAILAIGASLAAPTLSVQLANYRVRAAAEGIVSGLNQARAEAVRHNAGMRFELEPSSIGWSIAPAAGGAALARRAGGDTPGISATSGNASRAVVFLPTGQVDNTGTRMSRLTVSSAVSGTESRQIDILGGGLIRQCQPAITAANDPRRC